MTGVRKAVRLPDGKTHQVVDDECLENDLADLMQLARTAMDNDARELQCARAACQHKFARNLLLLAHADRCEKIHEEATHCFSLLGEEMKMWITTAGCIVGNLSGPALHWHKVSSRLGEVSSRVDDVMLPDWQSQGATSYRAIAQRRREESEMLAKLAAQARDSVIDISLLQALRSDKIHQAFLTQIGTSGNNGSKLPGRRGRVNAYLELDEDNMRVAFMRMSVIQLLAFPFYRRTSLIMQFARLVSGVLDGLDKDHRGWQSKAQAVAAEIRSTSQNVRFKEHDHSAQHDRSRGHYSGGAVDGAASSGPGRTSEGGYPSASPRGGASQVRRTQPL